MTIGSLVLLTILSLVLALPLIFLIGRKLLGLQMGALGARLQAAAGFLDAFSDRFGKTVSWLALTMVLIQTIVVVQRYVFGVSWIWLQESIMYMYGLMFLLAAGYTLLHDGHVRVDIFYREASERAKAWVNFIGTYLLLFPVMVVILDLGYPYFEISWRVKESSPETSGIPAIYVLKFAILVFASLMLLQAYSLVIRSAQILIGEAPSETQPQEIAPTI